MKKVISNANDLSDAVIRAISNADDRANYFNCKMYASFFLADNLCTQAAHDELIKWLDASYKFEKQLDALFNL